MDPAADEIAGVLRGSVDSARGRMCAARALVDQPALLALVEQGFCSSWTARLVMQDFAQVDSSDLAGIVDIVCDRVGARHRAGIRAWTGAEIRQCARRVAARRDVDWAAARRRARLERGVRVLDDDHGMSRLLARLPSADAHRIQQRLTAMARGLLTDPDGSPAMGEQRTVDQLRADLLVDLLLGTGTEAAAGSQESRGGADQVAVVVDLATLLGLMDDPAEMPGYGPIPAELARQLAADARWRMWIVQTHGGRVIATSPGTYRPTADLARLVRAREPFCRMPGCRRRSEACDLDHMIPWPRGTTTARNLGPLCRRHHNLKTHYGWGLSAPCDESSSDDGWGDGSAWVWRSPAGMTWADSGPPALPDDIGDGSGGDRG